MFLLCLLSLGTPATSNYNESEIERLDALDDEFELSEIFGHPELEENFEEAIVGNTFS